MIAKRPDVDRHKFEAMCGPRVPSELSSPADYPVHELKIIFGSTCVYVS